MINGISVYYVEIRDHKKGKKIKTSSLFAQYWSVKQVAKR